MMPFRKRTRASVNPFQVSGAGRSGVGEAPTPATVSMDNLGFVAGPAAATVNAALSSPYAVREAVTPEPVRGERPRSLWRRVMDWVIEHGFESVEVPEDRPVGITGLLFADEEAGAAQKPGGSAVRAAISPRFGRNYRQPDFRPQAGVSQ